MFAPFMQNRIFRQWFLICYHKIFWWFSTSLKFISSSKFPQTNSMSGGPCNWHVFSFSRDNAMCCCFLEDQESTPNTIWKTKLSMFFLSSTSLPVSFTETNQIGFTFSLWKIPTLSDRVEILKLFCSLQMWLRWSPYKSATYTKYTTSGLWAVSILNIPLFTCMR